MEGWDEWFQDISKQWAGAYLGAKYTAPLEIQKLQLQALGQYGPYIEGRPATGVTVSPTVLLVGAAVLVGALVLMRD